MNKEPFTRTEQMSCVYHGRTQDLAPPTLAVIFLLTVPKRCFCSGLLFLSLDVFVCMSLRIFILDSRLAIVWKKNCPFGFLLVVF